MDQGERSLKPADMERAITARLPASVMAIADRLGYELYAVGGCVRNLLLRLPPGDLDLAVVGDAGRLAREVSLQLGGGKVAIYARFGTALVRTAEGNLEFATARSES